MITQVFSTYRLTILVLLSSLLYVTISFLPCLVYAEIYTYEQNGVIIISSEPPPQPKRKNSRRKKRTKKVQREDWRFEEPKLRQKKKTRRGLTEKSSKKKRRRVKATKKSSTPKLPTPRVLQRLKSQLQTLSQKYKLPSHLLRSVFKSCHFVNPQPPSSFKKVQAINTYLNLTCISLEVAERMDKRNLVLGVGHKYRYVEHAAWLLRKLINDYRGDLTLALSAYFISAQNKSDFESVLAKDVLKTGAKMTLESLVKTGQNLSRPTIVDSIKQRQQAKAFFKYILTEL